jgi:cold shock CspA family protein
MNAISTTQQIDISGQTSGRSRQQSNWGKSGRPNMIEWSHPLFGSVQIELKQFPLGKEIYQQGPNTWCRINLGQHRPSEIVLDVMYSLNDGVELLHAIGKRVVNTAEADPAPFVIKVEWKPGPKEGDDPIPHLPQGYQQDFQLFLINKSLGLMVELEVTWVSRNGVLWVTVQDKLGAQVVEHSLGTDIAGLTSIQIGERNLTLVPFYNENCYPGFDPVASLNRSYDARADKVLGYANEFGAAIPIDECEPGEWKPEWPTQVPTDLAKKGYKKAVVMWYNLTLGYGFLQLEDGQTCFVHFKAILDENNKSVVQTGDFPVLEPATGCYVKWQLKEDSRTGEKKPAATAVRVA